MHTKHIDIRHPFLRYMGEYKDIDIQYIWSEDNPASILTKNTLEADFVKHMKRITEEELWELVDTGRGNFKNTKVTEYFMNCDNTEHYSHTIAEVVDGEHRKNWIW